MQINTNGKRNITLDFDAPKKFKLKKDGAEIPYIRTGKNSFRLGRNIDGVLDLEEVIEQPRIVKPMQLKAQQMALVNPNDVLMINQAAQQLEVEQNILGETQKRVEQTQAYLDIQQQRINESVLSVQGLETDNSERITATENGIFNLAGNLATVEQNLVDGIGVVKNELDEHKTAENPHGITKETIGLNKVDNTSDLDKPISKAVQSALDEKADKDEIQAIRDELGEYQEKNDRFTNALSNYTGGLAGNQLPDGGSTGQILAKRSDMSGDAEWIDSSASIDVDDELSLESENPVQNKVITSALDEKQDVITSSNKLSASLVSGLATVATSGSYTDLSNKPTIPTVNNATLTIQENGSDVATFTANASSNVTANISVPTVDQTYSASSTNAQSGVAVASAISTKADSSTVSNINSRVTTIESEIPAQASSSNQLADKNFVNSSIATNTANFIGTFNSVAELEAYTGAKDDNDYAFVVTTDSAGNTVYNRYKWNGSAWLFEYALNNSSFTSAQWASINSGATTQSINQISTNTANINSLQTSKQDALVSGTNIKTINNTSILGSGNISVGISNPLKVEKTVGTDTYFYEVGINNNNRIYTQCGVNRGGLATLIPLPTSYSFSGTDIDISYGSYSDTQEYIKTVSLSVSSNIARVSDIPTVDQTYSSSSANAQSGVAVASAISTKADDNAVVHLSGNETITGTKTFTGTQYLSSYTVITKGNGTGGNDEGGELEFEIGTNSVLLDNVHLDVNNNSMRIFGTDSNDNVRVVLDANIEENKVKVPTPATSSNDTTAATTAFVKNVLSELYPVGAIYIGTQATCPLATLISGSTWELVAANRALWGSDSNHTAGSVIAQGLPNIKGDVGKDSGIGHVSNVSYGISVKDTQCSGAFYPNNNCGYTATRQVQQGSDGKSLGFDASLFNPIYGASDRVQPSAYVVNIWRRTA